MLYRVMVHRGRKGEPKGFRESDFAALLEGDGGAVGQGDGAAVDGLQQFSAAGGHDVDDAEFQGLSGGDGLALAYGVVGELLVAFAQPGDGPGVGREIIYDLVSGGFAGLRVDGSGRADRGAGRHRGHVRGHGDDRPGGSGAGPGRLDIDDDRNAGAQEVTDDGAHRGVQAAGCVQFHQQRLAAAVDSCGHGVAEMVGDHGVITPSTRVTSTPDDCPAAGCAPAATANATATSAQMRRTHVTVPPSHAAQRRWKRSPKVDYPSLSLHKHCHLGVRRLRRADGGLSPSGWRWQ
ncbi:hypothetical protein ACFQZ4_46025 [Catellatospora coxensis]